MIPSRTWFPGTLEERAAWFENFTTNLAPLATLLGIAAEEMTTLLHDNEDFQSIAATTVTLDAFATSLRQYRISLTEGDVGSPHPVFPAATFNDTPNNQPAGVFQRMEGLVRRVRASANYTPEIGASLGIIPKAANGGNGPEGELKPVIKASQSFDNYQFEVNVTRMGQSGYKVQIQRQGQVTWNDVAFATNNPCTVTVTPTTPNDPERIYVRAILLSKNDPIGEPSDPTYVTVNP